MAVLVYIDRGREHLGILSAFDLEFAQLVITLLEQHSADFKAEIRSFVPGEEKKGS